jgi:hypothetical protein
VPDALQLDARRDVGQLLSTTWRIFTSHFAPFFTVTLLVYAPYGLLVNGLLLEDLQDGEADPALAARLAVTVLAGLTVPAIVTALHVVLVQGLARGEEPTVGKALRGAGPRLGVVLLVGLLYSLLVLLGVIALLVPGIYLAIRLYFGTQSAVVDGEGATGALRRSWELVQGSWWLTFGCLVLVALLIGLPLGILDSVADAAIDNRPAYVVVSILLESVGVSFSAIFGTLLFFSLRSAKRLPWEGLPRIDAGAPERPDGIHGPFG